MDRAQIVLRHLVPNSDEKVSGTPLTDVQIRDGCAIIKINNPPVNSLSPAVMQSIKSCIEQLESDERVSGIVFSGAGEAFVAGADISYIHAVQNSPGQESAWKSFIYEGHSIFNAIEGCKKPVVAAVNGVALGGGLELAMACHARIASPKSQLGLVELKLGIIPGLGGTQRLPRLVGVRRAVEMMLTSEQITAQEAQRLGLVDEVTGDVIERAILVARGLVSATNPRPRSSERRDKLEAVEVARKIVEVARKEALKKSSNVPYPFACLDAIIGGVEQGAVKGLQMEAELFYRISLTDSAKAMVHLFLAQRACSKVPFVTDLGLKPRNIRKVGVIGGGLMGSGIASALVMKGFTVFLKEINQQFLDAGLKRIKDNVMSRVKQGKMTPQQSESILARVVPKLDYSDFNTLEMVIEAAIENVGLKQQIFSELERQCSPTCILASNTSTIDISLIGMKTSAAHRIIGIHFFSPAHVMPLVEVVRTGVTAEQVIVDSLGVCRAIGKTAIVVGNCVGFTVNRIFFPYNTAAVYLVDGGIDPYRMDKALKDFGMPMGPFRLADLVGIDIAVYTHAIMSKAYADRTYVSSLPQLLLDAKRLGEKSGQGYYRHADRKATEDMATLQPFLDRTRREASIASIGEVSDEDLPRMLLFPVINEACRVLDEGMVVRASDIDIATVFGMGFPAYRGGVLKWADSVGAPVVFNALRTWAEQYRAPLFAPSPYLARAAMASKPLASLEMATSHDEGSPNDICIVAASRTPVTRAKRGLFKDTAPDDLLAPVLKKVLQTGVAAGMKPNEVGDVVVGFVLPKSDLGSVQVRVASLIAGLPYTVPVRTVNRLCSSGLQAIADVANSIRSGQYDVGIAAGVESMSAEDMSWSDKLKLNPCASGHASDSYLTMGQTSENVANRFGVSRRQQDELAAASHRKAAQAIMGGKFRGEIVPVETSVVDPKTRETKKVVVHTDEGVRPETTVESLAKLKPAFAANGTTTAGNASQVSDGASAVLVMTRRRAQQLGLPVFGVLRSFAVAGVEPSVMVCDEAPAYPIPYLLF